MTKKSVTRKKNGSKTIEELARGALALYSELGKVISWYKGGIHGPRLSPAEAHAWTDGPALAERMRAVAVPGRRKVFEVVEKWIDLSDARRDMTMSLALLAAEYVCGEWPDPKTFSQAVQNARADGFVLTQAMQRRIRAYASPRVSPVGKAYRVFREISKGAACSPVADARNNPREPLKSMIELAVRKSDMRAARRHFQK